MKKITLLICTVAFFVTTLIFPVFAVNQDDTASIISTAEVTAVRNSMELRNIYESDFTVDLLYNTNDEPSFLMGVSSKGYIIMERETWSFCESGNINPYNGYMQVKKYYGGPFCYYASPIDLTLNESLISESVLDILRQTNVTAVCQLNTLPESEILSANNSNSPNATSNEEVKVANAYSFIQRLAFGYNNNDTCSAVAVGIALNYLTYQHKKAFVPDAWKSETRNKEASNVGNHYPSLYPNANALYRYIVDTCGMGGTSYADGITVRFSTYVANKVSSQYGLSLSWTLAPRASTIKSNITKNLPVLITSTLAGDYSFHTMVVYGYREIGGSSELLVHTGWYGSSYNSYYTNSGKEFYYQNETWISKSYATYGYYFSFN